MRKVSVSTARDLLNIFWPEFIEVDGSVFLSWGRPTRTSDPDSGLDRTGMEAFLNHTHMIDLFRHKTIRKPVDENDYLYYDYNHPEFRLLCQLGKLLAEMWFRKLREDFPQYEFRLYYTEEDNPIIRFHRVRADEPYWMYEEHCLKEIEQEKIIIFDTRDDSVTRCKSDASKV